MSTPETNKIIKTTVHTSGGINKNLLTPCRRIGLSRNRKSSNRNSFISPVENKEPSHVNIEVSGNIKCSNNSDSLNVTAAADVQNRSKRKLKKADNQEYETKKEAVNKNKDEPVGNTNKYKKINISNKKFKNAYDHDEIKIEEVVNHNKDESVSNISKGDEKIDVSNKKSKNAHNQDEIKIREDNSNKNEPVNVKKLDVSTESSKITQNKRRKYILDSDEENVCNGFDTTKTSNELNVKKCLNYNSKIIDSEIKTFKEKNIISLSDSNKSDVNSENKEEIQANIKPKMQNILNQLNNSDKIIDSAIGKNKNTDVLTKKTNEKESENDITYEEKLSDKPNKNKDICASKVIEETSSSVSHDGIDYKKNDNKKEIITNGNGNLKNQLSENTKETKCKKNKSVKRKLSMKKSSSNSDLIESDEDVFVKTASQPNSDLQELESTQIVEKIIEIERRLQNKETELSKLQQAQVYRNLHKLEDLKREIDVWKSGCQDALTDLLAKLKEHATIDMNTLLINLKVPMHLFKYDTENDCFL